MKNSYKVIFAVLFVITAIIVTKSIDDEKQDIQMTSADTNGNYMVVPAGTTCGLQMNVKGALVVGTEKNSNLKTGDIILSVDNIDVESPADIVDIISKTSKTVSIKIARDGEYENVLVKPYFDRESNSYKLGAWIKEKIAGIGTISFYDPQTKKYAAIGHGIYEPETKTLINVKNGNLLDCMVESLDPGTSGTPGQICGTIYNIKDSIGTIEKNNEFGVFGYMVDFEHSNSDTYYPLADIQEVKKGDAYILSSLDGKKPRKYKIKITRLKKQNKPEIKGIEFKVTDKKLLDECGGIIQGMSGSPIIQDNKIIGCVTHVIIDDPESGYGVYARWMYNEMSELSEK